MKREYPAAAMVGVGAVIIHDGRVLLVKRGHAPLLGEWSIPGGGLELGESVREGVRREVQEETGLLIEPVHLLGVFDRVIRDDQERILYHYVLIDFLCNLLSGEAHASSDCAELQWFSTQELREIPLPLDTIEVINLGFGKKLA